MLEPPVSGLIGVAEAIGILDGVPVSPRVVELPLADAVDHRLAADLRSDRDHPPFDRAVMDGYAVRAADVSPGVTLARVATVAAGHVGDRAVQPGQAVAIMTGAPLPAGADAVVPVEQTTRDGDRVTFATRVRVGQAISPRASDMRAGAVVLSAGTRLGPAQLAVAASVGAARLAVFARPVVAVLSTGDELVDVGQVPVGAQIRNSNGPMLVALLRQLGCEPRTLGIARDEPDAIRAAVESASSFGAVFISGGMSMGERDHVPGVLRELGYRLAIEKLRVKPGKPFAFGVHSSGRFAFGLPGNPVSAFVCTARLAGRVLRRMAGGPAEAGVVTATITMAMPANGPREFYQPAWWDGARVTPLGWKGSADLFTLAKANALIVRPENAGAASPGEFAPILTW